MEGWIKISRNILTHWIFQDERWLKWWLDILLNANYEDGKTCVKGRIIEVKRGQLIASSHSLAQKWGCNRLTAMKFLQILKNDGMIIDHQIDHQINVITICKYEEYQSREDDSIDHQIDQQIDHSIDHQIDHKSKKNKESKEYIKKEPPKGGKKEIVANATALLEERKEDFYNSLIPYTQIYGKEMVRNFFDYWTEPNKSHTKMRFELEPTWDLKRRLNTWASREKVPPRNIDYGNRDNRTGYQTAEQRAADAADIIARLAAEDDANK